MASNRIRVFSELLSIDGWHSRFTADGKSTVHVEVNFGEARIGGDNPDSALTFRLGLRKASLVVKVSRPLAIERSSISRNVPEAQILQTRIRTVRSEFEARGGLTASISPARFVSAMSGQIKGGTKTLNEEEQKLVEKLPPILVASRPAGPDQYAWSMEPTFAPFLEGQPWDPVDQPRMAVRSSSAAAHIDANIEVSLTCALEDLVISDIRLKAAGLADQVDKIVATDLRRKAAEQQIRKALAVANLEPGEMDNRFSSVLLASVLAVQEADF